MKPEPLVVEGELSETDGEFFCGAQPVEDMFYDFADALPRKEHDGQVDYGRVRITIEWVDKEDE